MVISMDDLPSQPGSATAHGMNLPTRTTGASCDYLYRIGASGFCFNDRKKLFIACPADPEYTHKLFGSPKTNGQARTKVPVKCDALLQFFIFAA